MSNVSLSETTGLYTTSEVEQRTGVPATTLRQWERRYGMPCPVRSANGYRLYSPDDVARIEFLQARLSEGISISRAAELCQAHFTPALVPSQSADIARSASEMVPELLSALLTPNHTRAAEILSRALAHQTVEDVLMRLAQPALVEIGRLWEQGELSVAREHIATAFLRARITQLLEMAGTGAWGPTLVAACGPGEQHELGLLMLAVVLRRQGMQVHYLGANTPLRDLVAYVREVQADATLISVNVPSALRELEAHQHELDGLHVPLFLGGAQFNARPELAAAYRGEYLGHDAVSAAQKLVKRLKESHGHTS